MKTKEFIREIEKLGYKIEERSWYYIVKSLNGDRLGYAAKNRQYKCDTMQNITDEQVFKLIFEYAMTPVEEREEDFFSRFTKDELIILEEQLRKELEKDND